MLLWKSFFYRHTVNQVILKTFLEMSSNLVKNGKSTPICSVSRQPTPTIFKKLILIVSQNMKKHAESRQPKIHTKKT